MSDAEPGDGKKSPLEGILAVLRGLGGQLGQVFGGLWANPLVKMGLLGGLSLIGLVILLVLVVQTPWSSLLPASPQVSPAPQNGYPDLGGTDQWSPQAAPAAANDGVEHRESGSLADPVRRILPPAKDPFLSKPLLPPEPALFRDGELEFYRPPRPDWTLEDLRPFWPSLEKTLLARLRQRNHETFMKLLAGEQPADP